jgi:hypothetical protein
MPEPTTVAMGALRGHHRVGLSRLPWLKVEAPSLCHLVVLVLSVENALHGAVDRASQLPRGIRNRIIDYA